MRKAKSTAKIVFPSTRLVYKGKDEPLLENDTKEFKTIYSINKYACEQYLKMYSDVFDIRYCIFRICVPYGSLLDGVSSYGTAEFFIEAFCGVHMAKTYYISGLVQISMWKYMHM